MFEILLKLYENYLHYSKERNLDFEKLLFAHLGAGNLVPMASTEALPEDIVLDNVDMLVNVSGNSFRVFSAEEHKILDKACLAFLLSVEQNKHIDSMLREKIIKESMQVGRPLKISELEHLTYEIIKEQHEVEEIIVDAHKIVAGSQDNILH